MLVSSPAENLNKVLVPGKLFNAWAEFIPCGGGHMDLMQLAGSGPWVQTSPTGELIQASHLHRRDGISGSNLKGYHLALMMAFNCMVLLHRRTVEEAEAG
ncbi:hypothetical protein U1Q18_016852 [Sarracenia purpurea var. burkii]